MGVRRFSFLGGVWAMLSRSFSGESLRPIGAVSFNCIELTPSLMVVRTSSPVLMVTVLLRGRFNWGLLSVAPDPKTPVIFGTWTGFYGTECLRLVVPLLRWRSWWGLELSLYKRSWFIIIPLFMPLSSTLPCIKVRWLIAGIKLVLLWGIVV